jgi:hypothetical protein
MKVGCKVTVMEMKPNNEKGRCAIKWHFDFTNDKGDNMQILDMTVMHDLNK